jgi:protein-serine/threonine kinase
MMPKTPNTLTPRFNFFPAPSHNDKIEISHQENKSPLNKAPVSARTMTTALSPRSPTNNKGNQPSQRIRHDTMTPSFVEQSVAEGNTVVRSIPKSKETPASKLVALSPPKHQPVTYNADGRRKTAPITSPLLKPETPRTIETDQKRKLKMNQNKDQKMVNECLLTCAKTNDFEKCKELLNVDYIGIVAEINYKGPDGWSPLHYAVYNGNKHLVELFICNGADLDTQTNYKLSPLMITGQKGFDEVADMLINSGCDINQSDYCDNTALHYAALYGFVKVVDLLLRKPSTNATAKNKEGKTPIDIAKNQDVKKIFEKNLNTQQNVARLPDYIVKIQMANTNQIDQMFKYQDVKGPDRNGANSPTHGSLSTSSSNGDDEKYGPEHFVVHSLIGKGSFGEVYLVAKKNSNKVYAMKILNKLHIKKRNLEKYAIAERNIMSVSNHPFIVKLHYAFQTSDKLFMILDYCPGGDLGYLLHKTQRFTEEVAKFYISEVILAIEDLHKRDIIFRDLKPENVVVDDEGHARLTDFGLSKEGVNDWHQGAKSFCGSLAYLAPEMLKRVGHGKAVDWYLVGVVFYEMLVGIPPYYADKKEQLFMNIEKAPLKTPNFLSENAKDLINKLLERNPLKRLGSGQKDAEEIKTHSFFQTVNWEDVLAKKIKPPFIPPKKTLGVPKVMANVFDSDPKLQGDNINMKGWSFVNPND